MAWLTCNTPTLSPRLWATMARNHLGMRLPFAPNQPRPCGHRRTCRNMLDIYGYHTLSCRSGKGRYRVHQALQHQIFLACQMTGLQPSKERLVSADNSARSDIRLPHFYQGCPAELDVSVVQVQAPSYRRLANKGANDLTQHREKQKKQQWNQKVAHQNTQRDFIPLIVNSCGGWGKSFHAFFRQLRSLAMVNRRVDTTYFTRVWTQRFSMAISMTQFQQALDDCRQMQSTSVVDRELEEILNREILPPVLEF